MALKNSVVLLPERRLISCGVSDNSANNLLHPSSSVKRVFRLQKDRAPSRERGAQPNRSFLDLRYIRRLRALLTLHDLELNAVSLS